MCIFIYISLECVYILLSCKARMRASWIPTVRSTSQYFRIKLSKIAHKNTTLTTVLFPLFCCKEWQTLCNINLVFMPFIAHLRNLMGSKHELPRNNSHTLSTSRSQATHTPSVPAEAYLRTSPIQMADKHLQQFPNVEITTMASWSALLGDGVCLRSLSTSQGNDDPILECSKSQNTINPRRANHCKDHKTKKPTQQRKRLIPTSKQHLNQGATQRIFFQNSRAQT